MAYLPTQKALLGFRPISSHCSTQLHRHGIPAISQLTVEPMPSATMLPSMLWSIPHQKPYLAICGVSSMHCIMQGSRVLHHDLLLHLQFQTVQVGHEYVLSRHDMLHLQHQASEFFVVLCQRPSLS